MVLVHHLAVGTQRPRATHRARTTEIHQIDVVEPQQFEKLIDQRDGVVCDPVSATVGEIEIACRTHRITLQHTAMHHQQFHTVPLTQRGQFAARRGVGKEAVTSRKRASRALVMGGVVGVGSARGADDR